VRSNKVQDIHELDEDMQYRLPAIDDREVDLSLLTAVLCSSEQVRQVEVQWQRLVYSMLEPRS
jgi:intraflagellar transport protein 43